MAHSPSATRETDNIFAVRYLRYPYPHLSQKFTSAEGSDRRTKKRKRDHERTTCGDTHPRFDTLRRCFRNLKGPSSADKPVLHAVPQTQPTIAASALLNHPSEYISLAEVLELAAVGGMDGTSPESFPSRPICTTAPSGMCPSDDALGEAHQNNTDIQIIQPILANTDKKYYPFFSWRKKTQLKEPTQDDVEAQIRTQAPVEQGTPAIGHEQSAPDNGGSTSRWSPSSHVDVIVPSSVEKEMVVADERRRQHVQNM